MVEFTERERYIIATMFFMMNPMFTKVPVKIMGKALYATLKMAYDKEFTSDELQDLVDGVREEKNAIMSTALMKLNEIYPKF